MPSSSTCMSCVQEILQRFGGQAQLDKAIRAGRVIAAPSKTGLMMYFVPRFEFTRENLYRQRLSGDATKKSGDITDLANVQEDKFGFNWDPTDIIPSALGDKFPGGPGGSLSKAMEGMSSTMPPALTMSASAGWGGSGACVCAKIFLHGRTRIPISCQKFQFNWWVWVLA